MKKIYSTIVIVLFLFNQANAQWSIKNINEKSYHSGLIKFKNDSLGIWMKSNCYVIDGVDNGSAILKTTDAGETWETIPLNINFNFYDFQFVGDSSIFAIGHIGAFTENARSILLKSNNLGESWDSISVFPKQFLETIWFFNSDTGIVDNYWTVDGGISWNAIFVSEYNYTNIIHLFFPTAETGYAIGIGGINPQKPYFDENIFIKTEDKGLTWKVVSKFTNELTSIYFIDENTGFVGTNLDSIFKTSDGGHTWVGAQVTNQDRNIVKSIQFVSDSIGFATGSLQPITGGVRDSNFFISKTIDGGKTWDSYDTLGISLNNICFINDTVGFVSGDFELIMKTSGKIDRLPDNYPWYLAKHVGINETELSSSDVTIYPNPTTGNLFVRNLNPDNRIKSLELINSSGQSIDYCNPTYSYELIQFDLSQLISGMYLIKINYSDKIELRKIIKR